MLYESTRGLAPRLDFADVMLSGLAPDGGLFVPQRWPEPFAVDRRLPYPEFAADVMWPFVEGSLERRTLEELCDDAYSTFSHPEVVPISELSDGIQLVELFHGPTLAFKDIALQLLGRLFDYELTRRNRRATIVGATSGDTGSAAIEAFRDRQNVAIVILHPHGRTTEVQRRQMTTVDSPNVHNVAIEGTFDDCQDIVKAMFADESFRNDVDLAAVNSINWARVMAQVVYYMWSAAPVDDRERQPVSISVPTGNFGNVLAGRVAMSLGAPIAELVVASNRNDILTQFFTTGRMTMSEVRPTLSPSMDIQVSSNLERLIFELLDRDGEAVTSKLTEFRSEGHIDFGSEVAESLAGTWFAERVTDDETLQVMAEEFRASGVVLDPHTAVGVAAARRRPGTHNRLVMATAHPAKFPDAVEQATGTRPELPGPLADLHERDEHYRVLDNDVAAVMELVRAVAT